MMDFQSDVCKVGGISSVRSRIALCRLVALFAILTGCRAHYAVIPAAPGYLLRSPDGEKRAFSETTSGFGDSFNGWMDVGPEMALKLEKAYFIPPESRRVRDYRGLETVQYLYTSAGVLRRINYSHLEDRPAGQAPVTSALPHAQLFMRHHRLFFQVVLSKTSGTAQAVLVSSDSRPVLTEASSWLLRGESCPDSRKVQLYCTPIPTIISASLQMQIRVNGRSQLVLWGSTVASVTGGVSPVALFRTYRGRMVPVAFDPQDAQAARLPLWPGDVLEFESR